MVVLSTVVFQYQSWEFELELELEKTRLFCRTRTWNRKNNFSELELEL